MTFNRTLITWTVSLNGVLAAALLEVAFIWERDKDCATAIMEPLTNLPYRLVASTDQVDTPDPVTFQSLSIPSDFPLLIFRRAATISSRRGWWLHNNIISMVVPVLVCLPVKIFTVFCPPGLHLFYFRQSIIIIVDDVGVW